MGELKDRVTDSSLCSGFDEGEGPVCLLLQLTLDIKGISKGGSFHMVALRLSLALPGLD